MLLAATAVAAGAASCGDDADPRTAAPEAQDASGLNLRDNDRSKRRSAQTRPRAGAQATPAPTEKRTKARNGAVVILPDRPTETAAPPQHACRVETVQHGGQTRRFLFPPRPGISARRVGGARVLVSYRFSTTDVRCQPEVLELTLDVNDDSLPGAGRAFEIDHQRGTVTMPVPGDMMNADVVRATARTAKGLPSDAAAVLID
jgi:hypothetical protein